MHNDPGDKQETEVIMVDEDGDVMTDEEGNIMTFEDDKNGNEKMD
jgi:hypothetical protein